MRRTLVRGADGKYGAMFLSCIDSRFVEPVRAFTAKNGLMDKHCQFVIAGAAVRPLRSWQSVGHWSRLAER